MLKILVVEDDENYRFEISQELEQELCGRAEFIFASNLKSAMSVIENDLVDMVLLDIIFPLNQQKEQQAEVDYTAGVKFLEEAKRIGFHAPILVLSSQNKEFAVDLLIRYRFVRDYVFKDSSWKEICLKVIKQVQELEQRKAILGQMQREYPLIGVSQALSNIKELAARLRDLDTTVLIQGESGTGKEVVARYFHMVSSRQACPFLVVNCAAVPESLFESLLFGHKAGAFTGAEDAQVGYFEAASGGVLFLDEIGELPFAVQAKLLRVLQEKKVIPVGEVHGRSVDVRIIAATNQNLDELVKAKKFREDLYYRLRVLPVDLPPLRGRREDIRPLCEYFVGYLREKTGKLREISVDAMDSLASYDWPGNVRELKNTLERLFILSDGDKIDLSSVRALLPGNRGEYQVKFPLKESSYKAAKQGVLDAFHQEYFRYYLEKNNWQIKKAAEETGYNRNDLAKIVKKYFADVNE